MNKAYLKRLYQHNRLIFGWVSLFVLGTLFSNFMGDEISPFFVWGMFSEKLENKKEQAVIEIYINNEAYNYTKELSNFNRHMLMSPIGYYKKILDNDGQDPFQNFLESKLGNTYQKLIPLLPYISNTSEQIKAFKTWLKEYLACSSGKEIQSFRVIEVLYSFEKNQITKQAETLILESE